MVWNSSQNNSWNSSINNSQQELMRQFGQLIQMMMQTYHVQTFGGMQNQLSSSPISPLSMCHHAARYRLFQVKVLYRQKLQRTLLLLLYIRA